MIDALIAGVMISISTTGDVIPRNILLIASTTGSKSRGMDLGLFEACRYAAVALSPLAGAFAFEGGASPWHLFRAPYLSSQRSAR